MKLMINKAPVDTHESILQQVVERVNQAYDVSIKYDFFRPLGDTSSEVEFRTDLNANDKTLNRFAAFNLIGIPQNSLCFHGITAVFTELYRLQPLTVIDVEEPSMIVPELLDMIYPSWTNPVMPKDGLCACPPSIQRDVETSLKALQAERRKDDTKPLYSLFDEHTEALSPVFCLDDDQNEDAD